MSNLQLSGAQWVTIIVALIGIVSPLVTLAANIFEKFLAKQYENHKYKYELYHKLIEEIVTNEKKFAEIQIADIYELRRFRRNRLGTRSVLQSFYNANLEALKSESNIFGKSIRNTIKNLSNPIPIVWQYFD